MSIPLDILAIHFSFHLYRITPLDPWKTSMLLKAKKFISDQAGEGDVDLS